MRLMVLTCLLLLGFATSGAADEKPTVILYTSPGCDPCKRALRSLREIGIEPTVTRDCPAWVTQVPTIHWRDRAGVWRQHAPERWSGPTWSDLETAKIRRWLLPSSATKSTQAGGYLTVTSVSLPAPYYQRGPVTLYHADCLEILPAVKSDVVLGDLPYAIGLDYGDSFADSPEYLSKLINEAIPMMRAASPVVALTSGVGNVWRYPPPTWILCWYMQNGCSSTGKWGFNQWQPVIVYGTDPFLSRGMGRRPDLIITAAPNNGKDKKNGHPCPKPIEAWEKILLRVSPSVDDVVCDPFHGSGSTAVACIRTGRRCIGIELEERYLEIAAKRCDRELDQGRLPFDVPKRTETQRELFAEVANG